MERQLRQLISYPFNFTKESIFCILFNLGTFSIISVFPSFSSSVFLFVWNDKIRPNNGHEME